jgi:hypothetical protein
MAKGSCLCGGVRFEIAGPIGRASHCHCSMCRKAHGAAFATFARVRAADFRWTAGEELVAGYRSSPHVVRTFCSRCGSNLQWIDDRTPDRRDTALGVLDDAPGVKPSLHIFTADKAPWFEITDRLPQHAADG